MKKILFFVVALFSCVLVFNSCEKSSGVSHDLDGYTYHTKDFWPEETWIFQNGTVTRKIFLGQDAIIKSETLKYEYRTTGSKLYIGLDGSDYGAPIEDNPPFTGIVSEDFKTIEMTHHGLNWTYTVYRVN